MYPKADRNDLVWHGRQNLPFIEWSEQFSNKLPHSIIRALRTARGSVCSSIQDDEWQKRLALQHGDLWKINRLSPNPEGAETSGDPAIETPMPKTTGGVVTPDSDNHGGVRLDPTNCRRKRAVSHAVEGDRLKAKVTSVGGQLPLARVCHDEDSVEDGMLAVYQGISRDLQRGMITIYGNHPVFRKILKHFQNQHTPHVADEVKRIVEEVYCGVAISKVAHSEEMRSIVDKQVISDLRSPHALTIALLGLMAEDNLIRQRLSKRLGRSKAQNQMVA